MKPQLGVDLNGLRFPQPVLSASGCLATGHDVPGLVDLHKLGGVVTRSLTFGPSKGWATPRASETSSGLLTAVGFQNPGVLAFLEEDLPRLLKAGVPVVGSVAGASLGEYVNVASALHLKPGVVALEVCVSCPDDEREGEPFYARPERLTEVVGAVARLSRVPVFAKLPPLLPGLVETAQACVRAGAFGLTLIDHVPALAVDPQRLRTRTATPVGGLSGPAIKPVALAAVYQVATGAAGRARHGRGRHRDGRGRGRVPARRGVGRPGRHRAAGRPLGARRHRAGDPGVPAREGVRVARRAARARPGPEHRERVLVIPRPDNPLIVALDVSDLEAAETMARRLDGEAGILKVGLELFAAHGPEAVTRLRAFAPVFLDVKLHDIPTTVEGAARNGARLGIAMLTVHALGGEAMVAAAVRGATQGAEDAGHPAPIVLAVTVLSSLAGEGLASPTSLAFEAVTAGANGVVVSGEDVAQVREVLGTEACLVVPGIRPAGSNGHDQVRILTPEEAVERGADYLVVGRPITGSSDPAGVARAIRATVR